MENQNINTKTFNDDAGPEEAGITTIYNDETVAISERFNEIDLPTTYLKATRGAPAQEIKDFLSRPRVLASGLWSAASTSPLYTANLPFYILSDKVFSQKVQGFLGFRATAIVRVQVNATRFQQGRLILHHLPPNVENSDNPAVYSGWKGALTQHPNVQLDAATQTEMVLKVPYASSFNATDLVNGGGKYGQARLSIYSDLATAAGSNSAEYTVWGSFEDVELFGPTLQTSIIPQSGMSLSASAKEIKSTGPISSVSSTVSTIGKALSKTPALSAIGGATTWFADLITKGASAFGFSKPNVVGQPTRMRQENAPYHNNSDAAEATNIMSLFSTNAVGPLPVGRTDTDELSLQYLATRKSYYTEVVWDLTQPAGTTIIAQPCKPTQFSVVHTDTGSGPSQTWFEFTPLAFIGSMFEYWRGGITFTFKIPKTEFHSGRLVATFVPGENYVGSPPSINDGSFLMREIFDMRLGNEFTFTVPYTAIRPYLDETTHMGTMYVQVLNQLVAPDTVSSAVRVLIEVAGADDIEFQGPGTSKIWCPYVPKTYTIQSGQTLVNPTAHNTVGNVIGGGQRYTDGNLSSLYCIGENITSMRQLLKRRSNIGVITAPIQKYQVDPFFLQWLSYDNTVGLVQPAIYGDLLSSIASCFCFSRGGVRFYSYTLDESATIRQLEAYYAPAGSAPYIVYDGSVYAFSNLTGGSYITHNMWNSGIAEFQCPQYLSMHARLNVQKATAATYNGPEANQYRLLIDHGYSISSAAFRMSRSIADDYDLNFFVNVPPMVAYPH